MKTALISPKIPELDQKSAQIPAVSTGPDLRGPQTCGFIAFSLGKVMIWGMSGSHGSAQNSANVYRKSPQICYTSSNYGDFRWKRHRFHLKYQNWTRNPLRFPQFPLKLTTAHDVHAGQGVKLDCFCNKWWAPSVRRVVSMEADGILRKNHGNHQNLLTLKK